MAIVSVAPSSCDAVTILSIFSGLLGPVVIPRGLSLTLSLTSEPFIWKIWKLDSKLR